ncbi:MAG TPA: universal stress protein [Bacteroidales bacterium]|nr:universal stress protein [Bacteroidales bacterium]
MGNLLSIVREPSTADNYLEYVARFARELKAHVHIVYVEEEYEYTIGRPPAPGDYAGDEQSKRLGQAARVLSERIDTVLGEFRNDVLLHFSAELASMTSVIEDFTKSNQTDIVILEAEEPGGFIFASTSNDELIGEIKCPVLLVPRNTVFRPLKQIVYATAYSEKDLPAMKDLVRLTSSATPSIRLLHITDEEVSGEQLGKMNYSDILRNETGYSDIILEYLERKRNHNISEQILDYAIRLNADLLVVLKDDRNFFERIFNPDRTKKIARKHELPLLIYKSA